MDRLLSKASFDSGEQGACQLRIVLLFTGQKPVPFVPQSYPLRSSCEQLVTDKVENVHVR